MHTDLKKTLATIERCLSVEGEVTREQLHRMYDLTLRLMSQELAVIYDQEMFSGAVIYDQEMFSGAVGQGQQKFCERQSSGRNTGDTVTLMIREPLPSMKKLTEAVEEHWKTMVHTAIGEAVCQSPLPYFEKAFVEIEIVTTKGCNNAKVWDTSNRAIQVILNNLKGIFFEDDNMEHIAFSVVGRWGEKGATIVRILDFDKSRQIRGIS